MFDAIDSDDDRRITEKELGASLGELQKWGLKDATDASKIFKEIDADGGGKVLFDEFAHWAIKQNLDLEDDDDAEQAGEGSGLIDKSFSTRPLVGGGQARASQVEVATVDWGKVAAKLPWRKDAESSKKRKLLFRQFDPNGNGLLSLAEVDKAVVEDLQLGDIICKAVIMRAFQAAKKINKVCFAVHCCCSCSGPYLCDWCLGHSRNCHDDWDI